MWDKAKMLTGPIGCGTLFLAALLILIAWQWLWAGRISFIHPAPAIVALELAVVIFIIGLILQAQSNKLSHKINTLQAANGKLNDQLSHTPRVLGLELLVERWRKFAPQKSDSEILYEQISMMLSMARLHFDNDREDVYLLKYFSGTKIKGGVFLLRPGLNRIPLVIKFDSKKNIEEEERRYNAYVAQHLGQTPGEPRWPGKPLGQMAGEPWSAVTYNLIGANQGDLKQLQTFTDYYRAANDTQQIREALNKIFEALEPWWGNQQPSKEPLLKEYDRLSRNRPQMEDGIHSVGRMILNEGLATLTADVEKIDLDSNQASCLNPLYWVKHVFEAQQPNKLAHMGRYDSIVHGDFHGGNILVSEDTQGQLRAWLIDFPHTHVGPTLQDLARLEADIKFSLLPDDTLKTLGINSMVRFEESLRPDAEASNQSGLTDETLHKAWMNVCLLRHKATSYMIGSAPPAYDLALLYASLPILYYRDRGPWQKLYAFVSASLLCERLGT